MPSPDESNRRAFGALIAHTARLWRRAANHRLEPFGLTEATWLPLVRIARAAAPMRQKELAASLALDGSSVVRLLDSLEQAGLIRRREEADDRRAKTIVLTEQGRATADQVEAASRRIQETTLAGLPDADVDAAWRVLDHIRGVLAASVGDAA